MKTFTPQIVALALATTPAFSLAIHVCPLFIPAGFPNPFAVDEVGVLVPGQGNAAFTYGSDGPLGLWGAGPTANGCPGYAFLNAVAKTPAYSVLTWGASSTTNWNAAAGGYLTKLGVTPSSDFLACKKNGSNSSYVLILKTASVIPLSLESSEGDIISSTACVPTKILVTHAPGFQI
ncbi:hypothetical protein M407DRAFT_222949 [Tulasnella calospora MUT 4182]|uniref:Uncharacterized protein n=1 Tax=Tulasnella calospora MUT 4182 TaxID=1051891 RepID=A0A0C3QGG1_9AGAM|nr:hypothetical protein M407DRAFT_222949 [Tulasnella calospora MUT 4182]